jgi:hypothetical protein
MMMRATVRRSNSRAANRGRFASRQSTLVQPAPPSSRRTRAAASPAAYTSATSTLTTADFNPSPATRAASSSET